jgi:YggT family protein
MAGFVLRQFTMALATILDSLLTIYFWIVLIAVLLSWVNPDPRNPIVRFLYGVTEPVLHRIRHRLPFVFLGGFDFSPLLLMVGIQFAKIVLVQSLYELAVRIALASSGHVA